MTYDVIATEIATHKVVLSDCPPGLFLFNGTLGFKSEYKTESQSRPGVWQSDAYVIESGEYFWGGVSDPRKRESLLVVPLNVTMTLAGASPWA